MATKTGRQRRNNTGSIRPRGPERWQLVYTLRSGTGKARKQGYETVTGTRQAAEKRLREILGQVDTGAHFEPSKDTTADFMAYWLKTYAENATSPRTLKDYRGDVRRYIVPLIGHVPIATLRPEHVLDMLGQMRAKGLSERTLLHVYTLLNEALRHGIRWRKLTTNPCQFVDRPRPRRLEMRTLTPDTVPTFFKAIEGSPYAEVYRLDFYSGARRSEVLAIRWPQVDLDGRAISIIAGLHRIPGQGLMLLDVKTDKSRRRIPIPTTTVDSLRSIKGQQIEHAEMVLGKAWDTEGFVFCKADGTPFDPEKVTKDFSARMRAAGLKGITMHSLRHSFATLQLARGEATKVVQELLGHSSIAVTSDIYSHVIPGMKESAVDRFAEEFGDTYNQ